MPSAASFARSIRARERIDLETCAPGSSHGPPPSFDLPQTWRFHLCGRSASGCQSASEAIGEAPSDGAAYFRNARAIARVDHRTLLGAANCGYCSAGSNEGKDRWANLDNGQRSALVCGPRKFDKTATGKLWRSFMRTADCPPVIFLSPRSRLTFHDRHYWMKRQKRSLDMAISLVSPRAKLN